MPASYNLQFGGEELVLYADRTLWWPRQRILFMTDLHAGKAEHFRRYGSAIPAGGLQADLERLAAAAERTQPERLVMLGDIFHSDLNSEWAVFADWCRTQPYKVELVRGNHDRFLRDELLRAAHIVVHTEPYVVAPFTLRHHPQETFASDEFVLAGHLHPVTWVHGAGRDRLRLTCFVVQEQQMILPAFGSFTGGLVVKRSRQHLLLGCSNEYDSIMSI